jgi:hypothetical protein
MESKTQVGRAYNTDQYANEDIEIYSKKIYRKET